jgi:hypothetical protein
MRDPSELHESGFRCEEEKEEKEASVRRPFVL